MSWTFYLLTFIIMHAFDGAATGTDMTSSLHALLHLMTLTESTCGEIEWCTTRSQNVTESLHKGGCCQRCFCNKDCVISLTCCPDVGLSELLQGRVFATVAELRSAVGNETFASGLDYFNNDSVTGEFGGKNAHAEDVEQSDANNSDVASNIDGKAITECVQARLFGVSPLRPKSSSYLMVSRCPLTNVTNFNNVTGVTGVTNVTKAKCESPIEFIKNGTVRDFIPVQSSSTGVVYRNIYCSLCNGALTDTLVEWNVYVATLGYPRLLTSSDHFETMTELLTLIRHQHPFHGTYELLFEPGETLRNTNAPERCSKVDVSTCNPEIFSNTMDGSEITDASDLRQACWQFRLPAFINVNRKFTVFNNLACVLCNGYDLDSTTYGICGMYDPWETTTPYVGRIPNEHIEQRPEYRGRSVLQRSFSSNCDLGYIYDKRLDVCRKAHCPCGMVAHEGRCVFIFEAMHDKLYQLDIDIALTSQAPVKSNKAKIAKFQQALFQYFTNVFESNETFLVKNIVLMSTKGGQPNPKKYFARIIFSEVATSATFNDVVIFVANNFAGTKEISEGDTRNTMESVIDSVTVYTVTLSITDSILTQPTVTMHGVTGHSYEQVLPTSDSSQHRNLPLLSYILLSECFFCFMIELLDTELQQGSKFISIKPTGIVTAAYSVMYSENGTGYLVCADNVIEGDISRPTDIDFDDRTDTPKPADEEDSDISTIEMIAVWLSLGLVVVFVVSLRFCMRRWLVSRQNVAGPSTQTDDSL